MAGTHLQEMEPRDRPPTSALEEVHHTNYATCPNSTICTSVPLQNLVNDISLISTGHIILEITNKQAMPPERQFSQTDSER